MITFKPIIVSGNKRKDGTYLVYIRVTQKGKSRRLPTHLCAVPAQLTRSLKIKDDTLNAQALHIVDEMKAVLSSLSYYDLVDADVDDVVKIIISRMQERHFALDFFAYGEKLISEKKKGTASVYRSALNTLERFLGKRELDINDITNKMLRQYIQWVDDKGYAFSSRIHIGCFKYIYIRAQQDFNGDEVTNIPRNPFVGISFERRFHKGQPNLGVNIIQKMIDTETDKGNMRMALDVFLLSFCLYGSNMEDLYNEKAVVGEWWNNERNKTKDRRADRALICIKIPEQARPYIERLSRGYGDGWLRALRSRYSSTMVASRCVNRMLAQWAEENGVERFTFYAARHSFASLCRGLGVEKALVDEMLAHKGDYDMADIYAERDWEQMAKANEKLLALFRWNTAE